MKTYLGLAIVLVNLAGCAAFAADEARPSTPAVKTSVRMRFVPDGPPAKGSSDFKGASWTRLAPGPEKGVLWCQAHAGIGDEFPVINDEGVKVFAVRLAKGDDDAVVLEVRSKEGVKSVNLRRDKAGRVEIGGTTYELLYPSVSVAGKENENPTTNKVMLMVEKRL